MQIKFIIFVTDFGDPFSQLKQIYHLHSRGGVGVGVLFCWVGLGWGFFVEMQRFSLIWNTPNGLLLQVGTMYHSAVCFVMQAHYHTHYELWKLPSWPPLAIWHLNTDLCLNIVLILQKHLNIHWKHPQTHGFNLFLSIFANLSDCSNPIFCFTFIMLFTYMHDITQLHACYNREKFFPSFYCLFNKVVVCSVLASGWFNEALTRVSFSDVLFTKQWLWTQHFTAWLYCFGYISKCLLLSSFWNIQEKIF